MYPGARFAAEVLELKKLTAYASDATEVSLTTLCSTNWMYTYLTIFLIFNSISYPHSNI